MRAPKTWLVWKDKKARAKATTQEDKIAKAAHADKEDFPRNDIDINQVRHARARSRINRLRNDLNSTVFKSTDGQHGNKAPLDLTAPLQVKTLTDHQVDVAGGGLVNVGLVDHEEDVSLPGRGGIRILKNRI